ncbi:STAS domain-containing protein [candidate division CSSED10-310 bacterium]|uniref:STAS domain-containing protein n=1 Tax=candidate division CSSED10-310 bacterium TaxID=2855610 RepID=A0ABV6Z3J5_UNCC1
MEKLITEIKNFKNISLITLKGNLTAEADDPLFTLVISVLSGGFKRIVFDLSKVQYINSAGFGILIALVDEIKNSQGKVKFAALSPHFKKTAKLIGLHRFADFYRTVDEAFTSLKRDESK